MDLDGVLRFWDPAIIATAEQVAEIPSGALTAVAFSDRELLHSAVTGLMSDEEWRAEITHRLSASAGPAAAVAVAAWSAPVGEVARDVLDLVREVRRAVPVALFSNATSRLPHDLEALDLAQEVDVVINSSELGLAKPDPAAFLAAARRCGRAPQECLFVDDTPANVAGGRSSGMTAHLYTSVPDLRAHLAAAGLVTRLEEP